MLCLVRHQDVHCVHQGTVLLLVHQAPPTFHNQLVVHHCARHHGQPHRVRHKVTVLHPVPSITASQYLPWLDHHQLGILPHHCAGYHGQPRGIHLHVHYVHHVLHLPVYQVQATATVPSITASQYLCWLSHQQLGILSHHCAVLCWVRHQDVHCVHQGTVLLPVHQAQPTFHNQLVVLHHHCARHHGQPHGVRHKVTVLHPVPAHQAPHTVLCLSNSWLSFLTAVLGILVSLSRPVPVQQLAVLPHGCAGNLGQHHRVRHQHCLCVHHV